MSWENFRFIDLFAGIGGIRLGFESVGGRCVFSSEFDKDAEKGVILSLLTQIGWKSRIQSIVTENDLIAWYETALRGRYADSLGDILLYKMRSEMSKEFPSIDDVPEIIRSRGYKDMNVLGWTYVPEK